MLKLADGLRIGVVDYTGAVILESFVYVHPSNVQDWRSNSSGIKPGDLDGGAFAVALKADCYKAPTYETIQKQVQELVKGKIIVGHAAFNDLAVRDGSLGLALTVRSSRFATHTKLCAIQHSTILYASLPA